MINKMANLYRSRLCRLVFIGLFIGGLTGCFEERELLLQHSLVYCGEPNQNMIYNPQTTPVGANLNIISQQIFEPLFAGNPILTPLLVKSWTNNEDYTRYTLTLKENIQFQQTAWFTPTRPLTAEDVVFSFNRIINPENPFYYRNNGISNFPWFDSVNFQHIIKNIVALDQHRVLFILNQPNQSFLDYLSSQHAAIISAEYAQQIVKQGLLQRTIDRFPVGTGPFELNYADPQHQIRLTRNENYWQGKPPMKEIIFDLSAKTTGAFVKLLGQDCDMLASSSANQLPVINNNKRLASMIQPVNNTAFLVLNLNSPKLKNIKLRHAIAYGINRQQLVLRGYNNSGLIAQHLIPPNQRVEYKSDPTFRPKEAMALLKEINLTKLTLNMLVPRKSQPFDPNPQKVATILQEQLKELGITLNIVYNQTLAQAIRQRQKYDLILTGWILETPQPEMTLRPLLGCFQKENEERPSNPFNLSQWCNSNYDEILNQLSQTSDENRRNKLILDAKQLIQQELPIIPLIHNNNYWGYQTSLGGLNFNDYGFSSFAHVYRKTISQPIEPMEKSNNSYFNLKKMHHQR